MPVVSFRMDYSPADRWTVRAGIDQFFINQDNYSGAFNDFMLAVEHQTFKYVSFGLGYDRLQLALEVDDADYLGKVRSFWTGVMAYAAFRY